MDNIEYIWNRTLKDVQNLSIITLDINGFILSKEVRKPRKPKKEKFTSQNFCTCSVLGVMAPCSYCTNGGYCEKHECMRKECGCEWENWDGWDGLESP